MREELRHRCVTFAAITYPWLNRDGSKRRIEAPPVLVVSEKGERYHKPMCHYITDQSVRKKMVTPCKKCFPLGGMELSEDEQEGGAD